MDPHSKIDLCKTYGDDKSLQYVNSWKVKVSLQCTKNSQTPNMCILSAHVIGSDDDLKDIGINGISVSELCTICIKTSKSKILQAVPIFIRFRGDVECNPTVWFVQGHNAHVLQIARACAGAYRECRWSVGVI